MLCTINGETFHSFMKNIWIGDSGAYCHIANDDTGVYDITKVIKLVQGSVGNISATRKASFA